jgi:hypothetical protein
MNTLEGEWKVTRAALTLQFSSGLPRVLSDFATIHRSKLTQASGLIWMTFTEHAVVVHRIR